MLFLSRISRFARVSRDFRPQGPSAFHVSRSFLLAYFGICPLNRPVSVFLRSRSLYLQGLTLFRYLSPNRGLGTNAGESAAGMGTFARLALLPFDSPFGSLPSTSSGQAGRRKKKARGPASGGIPGEPAPARAPRHSVHPPDTRPRAMSVRGRCRRFAALGEVYPAEPDLRFGLTKEQLYRVRHSSGCQTLRPLNGRSCSRNPR